MKRNIGQSLFNLGHRRCERGGLANRAEACELRLLLSATAMGSVRPMGTSGGNVAKPVPPKVVRDPSNGGPNGTTFLANDASTPPKWTQQQQATIVPPLDANVVSTTPALNEFALPSGGSSYPNGPSLFGSSAVDGQTMAPSEETYSPSNALANNRGALSNGSNANPPMEVNGFGEILPLPALDLAFTQPPDIQPPPMQPLDLTSPLGW
jgi:hypothetical protein